MANCNSNVRAFKSHCSHLQAIVKYQLVTYQLVLQAVITEIEMQYELFECQGVELRSAGFFCVSLDQWHGISLP